MTIETTTLEVGDARYSGRVNIPHDATDRGVLVIPGAGHGPFGDVFDRFARAAAARGHTVARFETWANQEALAAKTDADFAAELDAGVEFLRAEGCSTITIVAKSFGGRFALNHAPAAADRMVLWAPAILFGEHADAPSITASELAAVEVPVRILHGEADDVVSVENGASIAEHLPNAEFVVLPGEDHSFRNDERRTVEQTLAGLPE